MHSLSGLCAVSILYVWYCTTTFIVRTLFLSFISSCFVHMRLYSASTLRVALDFF
jgi:hypothetical protein